MGSDTTSALSSMVFRKNRSRTTLDEKLLKQDSYRQFTGLNAYLKLLFVDKNISKLRCLYVACLGIVKLISYMCWKITKIEFDRKQKIGEKKKGERESSIVHILKSYEGQQIR